MISRSIRPLLTRLVLMLLTTASALSAQDDDSEGENVVGHAFDPEAVRTLLEKTRPRSLVNDVPVALHFEVLATGPEEPWLLAIVNRGRHAMDVVFDPRLFWFEITPLPSSDDRKPKSVRCRLPSPLFPSAVKPELVMRFAPGEGVIGSVDPRLYCPPARQDLTAGATVAAHFGWPPFLRTVWRKGKRVELERVDEPPFVASRVEVAPTASSDGAVALRKRKQLTATQFQLPPTYALQEPDDSPEAPPLELVMKSGSDAPTERQVTITVELRNRSQRSQRVFVRREHLSFEVAGPAGQVITCDPGPDLRNPSRMAFRLIRPNRSLRIKSRLAELCPSGTFGRPGLYVIDAYFDANETGAQYGLSAFTGRLFSYRPALVRVIAGSQPWLQSGELMRVRNE